MKTHIVLLFTLCILYSGVKSQTASFGFNGSLNEHHSNLSPDSSSCTFSYTQDRFGNPSKALKIKTGRLIYENATFSTIGTSDMSISLWVKINASIPFNQSVLSKVDDSFNYAYEIYYNTTAASQFNGRFLGYLKPTNSIDVYYCNSDSILNFGADTTSWTHIFLSIDRSDSMRLYINGVKESAVSLAPISGSMIGNIDDILRIGSDEITIDDIIFFKRQLSDNEIQDVYNGLITTNKEQPQNSDELFMYPNPFKEFVTINQTGHYKINDLLGRTVMQFYSKKDRAVNLSRLKPGYYYLKNSNNTNQTELIIKN